MISSTHKSVLTEHSFLHTPQDSHHPRSTPLAENNLLSESDPVFSKSAKYTWKIGHD